MLKSNPELYVCLHVYICIMCIQYVCISNSNYVCIYMPLYFLSSMPYAGRHKPIISIYLFIEMDGYQKETQIQEEIKVVTFISALYINVGLVQTDCCKIGGPVGGGGGGGI